jgi:hypothetical protein
VSRHDQAPSFPVSAGHGQLPLVQADQGCWRQNLHWGSDVAAYQAGEKERLNKKQREVAALTQKESYSAYDLVIEYLLNDGHANTISEAEYVMTELDENFINSLIENYESNLIAEEVEDWVSQLLDEGYDLSEYSWDDMVDYYFSS